MKRAAVIVMMFAQIASASWNTNIWPAHEYTRKGNSQLDDVYNALEERKSVFRTVAQGNFPTISEPQWYRLKRSIVVDYKDMMDYWLRFNRELWVNTNIFSGGVSTNCDVSLEDPFPWHSATSLLSLAQMPTNYFDYTPWRCLSGLGPFTNDTTVGRGYGWTNEYTAAGGTNFPGSRTNWYTTDYGIQGFKTLLPYLTATLNDSGSDGFTITYTNTSTTNTWVEGEGTSWASAIQDCETEWNNGNWVATNAGEFIYKVADVRYQVAQYGDRDGTNYIKFGNLFSAPDGLFQYSFATVITQGMTTNINFTADVYANWWGADEDFFGFGSDRQSTNAFDTRWDTISVTAGTVNVVFPSSYFGTLDLPDSYPGTWSDTKQVIQSPVTLLKWDFEYQ